MKIQTKIGLAILPVILLSIIVLGWWAVQTTKKSIENAAGQHMATVLDSYVADKVSGLHKLLVRNLLDKEESFVKQYQLQAAGYAKELKLSEGGGGCLFAMNTSGRLVFTTGEEDPRTPDSPWGQLAGEMAQSLKFKTAGHINSTDEGYFYAARYFKPWGWIVFYVTSDAEIYNAQRSIQNATVLIAGSCAAASMLLILLFFRHIFIKPIKMMNQAAASIAKGEAVIGIDVHSRDELGDLSRAMEMMSQAIDTHRAEQKASQDQLENKVSVQTDHLNKEIDERKQTEAALKYQSEFLKNVIESLAHPFYVINADDYTIKLANSAAGLGTISDASTCHALTHHRSTPCDGTEHLCPLRELKKTKQPVLTEHIHYDQQGNKRHMEVHGHPIFDDHGNVVQMIEYALDITDRKKVEAEREALIAELEAKNTELEQFTYTVSHDLKSPLITINGFIGLLAKDLTAGDTQRIKADIARISDAAEKMGRLLEELLELSRIGRVVNPPEQLLFGELAQEAVELTAGRLAEANIKVDFASGLPTVFGDRSRIRQLIENLVDNAAKFMGDQSTPRIEIGTRLNDREIIFYVRDNGIGIDPKYHRKIFELFDKLDPKSNGTGVGLAIVKRIVETHGGRIWVESKGTGKGSTFCFTIPKR